jgi:hypothetical protein
MLDCDWLHCRETEPKYQLTDMGKDRVDPSFIETLTFNINSSKEQSLQTSVW